MSDQGKVMLSNDYSISTAWGDRPGRSFSPSPLSLSASNPCIGQNEEFLFLPGRIARISRLGQLAGPGHKIPTFRLEITLECVGTAGRQSKLQVKTNIYYSRYVMEFEDLFIQYFPKISLFVLRIAKLQKSHLLVSPWNSNQMVWKCYSIMRNT